MIEAREMFACADTTQRMSNLVGFSSSVLKMAAPLGGFAALLSV